MSLSVSDILETVPPFEAMKMQTTIYSPCDGVVDQILVPVGETVESKDLLMKLRAA